MAKKSDSFEAQLKRLEEIVKSLEGGQLALEESLKLFEEGVRLSRQCHERLGEAESLKRGQMKAFCLAIKNRVLSELRHMSRMMWTSRMIWAAGR